MSVTRRRPSPSKGDRFGRLSFADESKVGRFVYWACVCDCGNAVKTYYGNITQGKTLSCGCIRKEVTRKRATTHGKRHSRLYGIWCGIKRRCYNPRCVGYADYGGRGIRMSEEWKTSFAAFQRDMGDPPDSASSIDRIDVNGDYCITNCRWATMGEQNNNKRNNITITYNGITRTVAQWEKALGFPPNIICQRITRLGWNPIKAITTTPRKKHDHSRISQSS